VRLPNTSWTCAPAVKCSPSAAQQQCTDGCVLRLDCRRAQLGDELEIEEVQRRVADRDDPNLAVLIEADLPHCYALTGSRTKTGLKPEPSRASAACSKGSTAVCTRRGLILPLASSARTSGISGRALDSADPDELAL